MKKKKEPPPEYPKIVETFRPIGVWELRNMSDTEPSAFNGMVRVEKYKLTIEQIEEPIEVIHERLENLWLNCNNWHQWQPLKDKAKQYNYEFKGERGSLVKKAKM